MPLLFRKTAVLLELSVRLSDLRPLFSGEYLGTQQWTYLDLPGLRPY
jgi:hypothetical protein